VSPFLPGSFCARGDEETFSVMIFAQSLGFMPAAQTFDVGPDWKEYSFAFEDFNVEGFDIMGIFIGASNPGSFTLQIDNVELGSDDLVNDGMIFA